jgi:hypothetical protein
MRDSRRRDWPNWSGAATIVGPASRGLGEQSSYFPFSDLETSCSPQSEPETRRLPRAAQSPPIMVLRRPVAEKLHTSKWERTAPQAAHLEFGLIVFVAPAAMQFFIWLAVRGRLCSSRFQAGGRHVSLFNLIVRPRLSPSLILKPSPNIGLSRVGESKSILHDVKLGTDGTKGPAAPRAEQGQSRLFVEIGSARLATFRRKILGLLRRAQVLHRRRPRRVVRDMADRGLYDPHMDEHSWCRIAV